MSKSTQTIKVDDPQILPIIHELRGLEFRLRDKHAVMQENYGSEWDDFNKEIKEEQARIMERLRFALGTSDISGYLVNVDYLDLGVAFLEPEEEEIQDGE